MKALAALLLLSLIGCAELRVLGLDAKPIPPKEARR